MNDAATTVGSVMLATLPLIMGAQFLLSWLGFDIAAERKYVVHTMLKEHNVSGFSPGMPQQERSNRS